jgi:glycosyltransferase 2 family protein
MNRLAKSIVLAANITIFIGLLVWVRNNVSFDAVLVYLTAVPPGVVLLALGLNLGLLLVYGWRLSCLLERQFLPSLATATLGFGLNGILPFRLGELAKIAYANALFAIPPVSLAAATAVEKLFDLGALTLLGLWSMQSQNLKFGFANGVVVAILQLFVAGSLLLIGGLWAVHRYRHAAGDRAAWLFAAVDLLLRKGNPRTFIAIVLWTAMIWLITIAMIFVIYAAMFTRFSVSDAVILSLIVALAIAVPSAPAGLGIVEAGIVGYLHQVLDVDPNQALAAALAFHFVTSFPQILTAVTIVGWNLNVMERLRSRLGVMMGLH